MNTKFFFPSCISSLAKLNRMLTGEDYKDSKFFIIVDENTYNNCLPLLISKVSALEQAEFFEVPVGEEAKSIEVATQLWGALLDSDADRNSVIINLGGGCVSDIGGFVAAGFKRGIRYINVPTTLIGMVDAAIGGKTAVDIENAKNQIGFFHQPEAVCIFPDFLDTLPDVEIISGVLEMAKTLLLSDAKAFNNLAELLTGCSHYPVDEIKKYIVQCVDFKRSVVNADPYDKSIRKILNFGHTFGHAIESYMLEQHRPMPHGIAVGMGLECALYLSTKKHAFDEEAYSSFKQMLHYIVGLERFTLADTERILSYMRQDKKNRDGLILCVLLQDIAAPVIDVAIDENEIRDALLKVGKF
ncbi:MAG: 3-dehydroquinate synthase [Bacteroidales bacterium]|nr:3-dehydroquinate synthase [Bacteroidales bacterium]